MEPQEDLVKMNNPQLGIKPSRRPAKSPPERTDSLIMGLGAKPSTAPRVAHTSTMIDIKSPRVSVRNCPRGQGQHAFMHVCIHMHLYHGTIYSLPYATVVLLSR